MLQALCARAVFILRLVIVTDILQHRPADLDAPDIP